MVKKNIRKFIYNSGCNIIYDPFAGSGELLKVISFLNNKYITVGLDIDKRFGWKYNDSLEDIPHIDNAIIITNPPYLAKQSATRKKIDLSRYFFTTKYDDIYLLALDNMLKAQTYIVAIIPESFINSTFNKKNLLSSITVLEENPFLDTETPVCVVCFDGVFKDYKNIKVYKNDNLVSNFWLELRAVDSSNDNNKISFALKENMKYDWNKKIKVSSRHITLINMDVPIHLRNIFIQKANEKIQEIRIKSADLAFTAFKGNTKSGIRRRRVDFKLVRAVLEIVYKDLINEFGEKYEA